MCQCLRQVDKGTVKGEKEEGGRVTKLSLEQGAREYKLGGVIKGLLVGASISKVVLRLIYAQSHERYL